MTGREARTEARVTVLKVPPCEVLSFPMLRRARGDDVWSVPRGSKGHGLGNDNPEPMMKGEAGYRF